MDDDDLTFEEQVTLIEETGEHALEFKKEADAFQVLYPGTLSANLQLVKQGLVLISRLMGLMAQKERQIKSLKAIIEQHNTPTERDEEIT